MFSTYGGFTREALKTSILTVATWPLIDVHRFGGHFWRTQVDNLWMSTWPIYELSIYVSDVFSGEHREKSCLGLTKEIETNHWQSIDGKNVKQWTIYQLSGIHMFITMFGMRGSLTFALNQVLVAILLQLCFCPATELDSQLSVWTLP